MREEQENFKEKQYKPIITDHVSRIYIVSLGNEYFIVYDPGYEYGNIYIYKQIETIPVSMLKEEFKKAKDRYELVYFFIKKKFIKEPDIIYGLCYE
jgi:hypothetical protein